MQILSWCITDDLMVLTQPLRSLWNGGAPVTDILVSICVAAIKPWVIFNLHDIMFVRGSIPH